jgi:Uma2 family endonuclease
MAQPIFESVNTMDAAEFAAWIEGRQRDGDLHRYELLNGRVVMTPPAGWPHGQVEAEIVYLLRGFVVQRDLGRVFGSSQGFVLPTGDTVEPDASFVGHERWASAPPPVAGSFLHVVPDLVVEILSTSTASRDRGEKKAIYAAAGVREYWLVDARARTLTVFCGTANRFDGGRIFEPHEPFSSGVLPGLVVQSGSIF